MENQKRVRSLVLELINNIQECTREGEYLINELCKELDIEVSNYEEYN